MRRLTSIVAVNRQGVIGLQNALPWRVKSDMRFFKEQTEHNVVIMGRKTYDSLGKCLPKRVNVVVSHSFSLFPSTSECILQNSIRESLIMAERAPQRFREIFVIGGASMYEQFSSLVDRYLITIVDKEVPNGDAFFDESFIGDLDHWERRELQAGDPDADGNEAPFTIFELTARDLRQRRAHRSALLGGEARSGSTVAKKARVLSPKPEGSTFAFG